MSYYQISYCGDYGKPIEIDKINVDVKNGKYFLQLYDSDTGDWVGEEEVYTSKKDAWEAILATIDEHLFQMQKKRDEIFTLALEDGAFIKTKEEIAKYLESLKALEK